MLRDHVAMPEIVKSMGLVFGDIGTSPIYTLTAIFLFTAPTPQNVMGILSLIFWTLTILVTVEYTVLAMKGWGYPPHLRIMGYPPSPHPEFFVPDPLLPSPGKKGGPPPQ